MAGMNLYVLKFGDGMVKFGISRHTSDRRHWYKSMGFPAIVEEVWIETPHALWAEGIMTRRFERYRHIGREYLVGVEFDDAVEMAADLLTTAEARANGFLGFSRNDGETVHCT